MSSETDEVIVAHLHDALRDAVGRLSASGARDEALAEFVPARRVMLMSRGATMRPIGRVWRLGVFLLNADAELFGTGSITRAVAQGRPNHQSVSAETRREFRHAATRGGFAPGETVNFGAKRIPLDGPALRASTGPLFIAEGKALVHWSRSAGDAAVDFDAYLDERVDLAMHPPEGT